MYRVFRGRIFQNFILVICLVAIVCFSYRVDVYAEDSDSVISVSSGLGEISSICSSANNSVNKKILKYDSGKGILKFSNSTYSVLDIEKKRIFMREALGATRNCSLGTQQRNRIYNFIAEQDGAISSAVKYLESDTSADFAEAKLWFAPFSGPISTVLGFLAILIFTFMGASIIFDIAYLVLPPFQLLVERGEDNKRPFGVSNSAWKVQKKASSAECDESIMSLYLKKRLPEIIIVSACLGYLVSGKLYELMVYFIDAYNWG